LPLLQQIGYGIILYHIILPFLKKCLQSYINGKQQEDFFGKQITTPDNFPKFATIKAS